MKQVKRFPLCVVAIGVLLLTSATVSADVFTKPSVIKELGTSSLSPDSGTLYNMLEMTRDAGAVGAFTVPIGKVFVITTVMIFPQTPGAGTLYVQLFQNSTAREYWVVLNSQPTSIQIPTGIVVGPEYTISIKNRSESSGNIRVSVFGYLAKDR
jgi:hypothetical protein